MVGGDCWREETADLTFSKLSKKTVNFSQLSSKDNWINHLNIDCEKYEKFVENYNKIKGSPDKPYWNIVIEYIENDLSLLKKI